MKKIKISKKPVSKAAGSSKDMMRDMRARMMHPDKPMRTMMGSPMPKGM